MRQQYNIGGTENVLSVENPIEGPSENPELNRCTAVPVEIEVELPSGEKRATHITLDPDEAPDLRGRGRPGNTT